MKQTAKDIDSGIFLLREPAQFQHGIAKRAMALVHCPFAKRVILLLGLVALSACVHSGIFGQNIQFEYDTDRYGSDYNSFGVNGGPESCRDACIKDPKCQAFTYRVSGPYCWLKNPAPNPTPAAGLVSGVKRPGTAGGGSLNFLQNAFVLGVQTGFVEMIAYGNLDASYLIQQVLPAMPSYAAALGLPQDQLNAMIAQLQSGAASGDAYPTVEGMYAQFDQRLNRNCVCGNVYNLAKAYEAGQQIGWAEMVAYMAAHQNVLPALAGVLANARQAAAVVGLPTNGLEAVIARVQAGASGCDVAPDLQNIEKQFEQSTNQPCTCMVDVNSQPNPNGGRPMNPTPLGPGPSPQPSTLGQGTCGRVIYQNNGTIFGGVDGHPLVVRPNSLQARSVHLEVPANTFLNLDAVMIFDSTGTNVALNKPARQSSNSPWTQPNGAEGALDGHKPDGGYHIHTNIDQNNPSWWEVDLQQVYTIAEIRVYNRMDEAARAANLKICVSGQPNTSAGQMSPGNTTTPAGTATGGDKDDEEKDKDKDKDAKKKDDDKEKHDKD